MPVSVPVKERKKFQSVSQTRQFDLCQGRSFLKLGGYRLCDYTVEYHLW